MIRVYYTQAQTELVRETWLTGCAATLPPVKREQILRLKPLQGRLNSLLGWRLVEFAFRQARQFDFDLNQLVFDSGRKPRWPRGNFDFNISHSKSLVVCALTENADVGIDVEHIQPLKDKSLFERILAPNELLPPGDTMQEFFQVWTRKEAVIKAAGDGGVWDMQQVMLGDGSARYCDRTWYLYPLSIIPGYAGCAASNHAGQTTTVEAVDMRQLIGDIRTGPGTENHGVAKC
jgi:4'-phosphopantetheinyl transferase